MTIATAVTIIKHIARRATHPSSAAMRAIHAVTVIFRLLYAVTSTAGCVGGLKVGEFHPLPGSDAAVDIVADVTLDSDPVSDSVPDADAKEEAAPEARPDVDTRPDANAEARPEVGGDGRLDAAPEVFVGSAVLMITPPSASFGQVFVGQTSAESLFMVRNAGNAPAGILRLSVDTMDFAIVSDQCSMRPLPADSSCTLGVVFRPTVTGVPTGNLTAEATPGGSSSARLSGVATQGTGPP
jgi:hypothetical protein